MQIMALPPTNANPFLCVQQAHPQMILWKAADQPGPPSVDIERYGWSLKDGTPSPTIAANPPVPPGLIDALSIVVAKPVAMQLVLVTRIKYLALCLARVEM